MARKPLRATPTRGMPIPLDEALRNGDDNFIELYAGIGGPGGAVDSVNGQTGVVVLSKADIGLGSADDTSDAGKPVSTAQQTALNLKANLASPALTGTPTAPTPAPADNSTKIATTAYVDAASGGGSGDVVGPASAVNNGVALFDGTTGKLLKDGGATAATINGFAIPFAGTASLTQIGAAGGGANNFTGNQQIDNAEPRYLFNSTGGGTNGKLFDIDVTPTLFSIRTRTDVDGAGVNILTATRSAASTSITNVTIGAGSATYTFTGSGTATFSGALATLNIAVSGTGVPSNGIYRPGTNRLGLSSNTTLGAELTAASKWDVKSGYLPDAGGLKHARVTTGSVGAGSTALVTITWGTAFADANYTVSASVLEATTSSLSMSVVHVESQTAADVTVRVINNAVGSLTGTVHVIAIHD